MDLRNFNNNPETLIILQEECSELITECLKIIKVVSKILRFGMSNFNPKTPTITNRDLFIQELGDVFAIVEILKSRQIISEDEIQGAIERKLKKLPGFYNFQSEEE